MRHQRAFRRTGRAARVDQDRRVVRVRRDGVEMAGRSVKHGFPGHNARCACARDADDVREARTAFPNRQQVRQRLRVDERGLRLAVLQPVFERLGTEQERQRHGDGAELVDGDVRDRRFRPLREDQSDLVAATDPVRRERVGKPVRLLRQIPERPCRARAVLVFPVQREACAIVGPARAACLREIEVGGNPPAMRRVDFGVAIDRRQRASITATPRSDQPLVVGPPTVEGPLVTGAAVFRVLASSGSIAVHTQSGCCSIRRPKRIRYSARSVDT